MGALFFRSHENCDSETSLTPRLQEARLAMQEKRVIGESRVPCHVIWGF